MPPRKAKAKAKEATDEPAVLQAKKINSLQPRAAIATNRSAGLTKTSKLKTTKKVTKSTKSGAKKIDKRTSSLSLLINTSEEELDESDEKDELSAVQEDADTKKQALPILDSDKENELNMSKPQLEEFSSKVTNKEKGTFERYFVPLIYC